MFSNNYVIPSDRFKVFGNPKEISKIADSGKRIVNCFCGDCGKSNILATAFIGPGLRQMV
jgi:hypothetical protein